MLFRIDTSARKPYTILLLWDGGIVPLETGINSKREALKRRTFWRRRWDKISWEDKYRLAFKITSLMEKVNVSEIKPGPELNRAVAEAIGDEPGLPFSIERADRGEEGFTYKPYSTDIASAFEAAEKVLFTDRCGHMNLNCGFSDPGGPYFECEMSWADGDGWVHPEVTASGSTPALAICAAILKLSEKSTCLKT